MNISHKLITLGLAFSLLGSNPRSPSTMRHFENGGLSYEKKTLASHVPTANAFGATGYARPPSAMRIKMAGRPICS